MTPPTDSLEAAIRAVPCRYCLDPLSEHMKQSCWRWSPEAPTLAAAVREWIRRQMPHLQEPLPGHELTEQQYRYNRHLAAMAWRLGL